MTGRPLGLLLDLDGTVYEDGALVPGADEAISALREGGIEVRFVTNTTRVSSTTIAGWLRDLGVAVRPREIFTPLVTASTLLSELGIRRVALLMPEDAFTEFAGLDVVEADPQAVVIGDLGPEWTFDRMNRAFRWLLDGADFMALHRNRYWKSGGQLVLDVGAFVAAFEYATGREATLVGKPSRPMFEAAARSMGVGLDEIVMVGDDLQADIGGSQTLGIRAFLVRTGKFRPDELEASDVEPEAVIDSIAALPGLLLETRS